MTQRNLFIALVIIASAATSAAIRAKPPSRSALPARSAATPKLSKIIVDGTLETALGQPRVRVQLADGPRILTGEPGMFEPDDAKPSSFMAFLDTGAGGLVLSKATAKRFGIRPREGAEFHEVGLHGETIVNVGAAINLSLAPVTGDGDEAVAESPGKFTSVLKEAVFQISREEPSALMSLNGDLNVIGMAVIKKLVVEIDPAPMAGGIEAMGTSPAVRLLDAKSPPRNADIEISLEYIDYNQRKHPGNRGPLPTLAPNPTITDVVSANKGETFTGQWLLDTGAATSIISTRHAQKLGLLNADGTPAGKPPFTLPLGGIGGQVKPMPGFVIDQVTIKAKSGRLVVFKNVHVVVQDIAATVDSGRQVVLDGVLGMNLLLPSAAGLVSQDEAKAVDPGHLEKAVDVHPGLFERIWIDGPRGMLALKLKSN